MKKLLSCIALLLLIAMFVSTLTSCDLLEQFVNNTHTESPSPSETEESESQHKNESGSETATETQSKEDTKTESVPTALSRS